MVHFSKLYFENISMSQILKKICDHPLLLTKRAAEDVLNGMDSMLKPNEVNVAEILVKHITDVVKTYTFKDENDVPCKISFIMSLLGNLIAEGHRVLIFSQTRMMLNFIQVSSEITSICILQYIFF
ncbi:putative DNA helicase [Medicago truncatula]|uniref:Putative DNA helicase n=1 Tax=Medicago truncatula TaxID=3880 RepID=A0A396GRZ7_MEDTR|nr:putative DNA helicase [Medicago truncatula]